MRTALVTARPNCTASWVQRTVTGQDAYGDDTFAEVTVAVAGIFAPGGSTETTASGDQVTTQPTLYLPAPAPSAVDTFTINGAPFQVDGAPEPWPANPFTGRTPAFPVVVKLRRTTG